ncbi:hypothetical protein [Desulfurococcus mucosus]|uniref:Uncharacterized protein n=1 Tax=Desulfurococcus mucosus (strain ATCC 35584 / DSM 2162 / JCM 9187 / O7/1) TaxID=765177 RepID=E8R9S5_DESM0|nr:hypothetical protein [Desulfurococcus mucosus]ADV65251.1 hypothetical protein Desmu_0948 [Desulfurococcus mucosus DSM 2162]
MVPVDAAPGEVLRIDEVSEGRPTPKTTTSSRSIQGSQSNGADNHGLSNLDEKLDLLIALIRELSERIRRLEETLEKRGVDHPEVKMALEIASAFSLPLLRSLEIARNAYEVIVRLGEPDPITRAIIEALSDCSEASISEIHRRVRGLRGRSSRRIVGERVRRLIDRGVLMNMGSDERPRIVLRRCVEGEH